LLIFQRFKNILELFDKFKLFVICQLDGESQTRKDAILLLSTIDIKLKNHLSATHSRIGIIKGAVYTNQTIQTVIINHTISIFSSSDLFSNQSFTSDKKSLCSLFIVQFFTSGKSLKFNQLVKLFISCVQIHLGYSNFIESKFFCAISKFFLSSVDNSFFSCNHINSFIIHKTFNSSINQIFSFKIGILSFQNLITQDFSNSFSFTTKVASAVKNSISHS